MEKISRIKYGSEIPFELTVAMTGSGKSTLIKSKIEDIVIHQELPFLIVDLQGDLCSLSVLKDKYCSLSQEFKSKADVKIYTPGSDLGFPLSLNPFTTTNDVYELEEQASAITDILNTSDKKTKNGLKALIGHTLGKYPQISSFSDLAKHLQHTSMEKDFCPQSLVEKTIFECNAFSWGVRNLIFEKGEKLDIQKFFSKTEEGKIPVSIIYLNELRDEHQKQFFMQLLVKELHSWMIKNPPNIVNNQTVTKGVFVLDECKRFIPAVSKPIAKEPITYLLQEMRKYGVTPFIATQSPGKIDYECVGTTSSKYIGRMESPQEIEKVLKFLNASDDKAKVLRKLIPQLRVGEFLHISKEFQDIVVYVSRNSYTLNRPLREAEIKRICDRKKEREIKSLDTFITETLEIEEKPTLEKKKEKRKKKKKIVKQKKVIQKESLIAIRFPEHSPEKEEVETEKEKEIIKEMFQDNFILKNLITNRKDALSFKYLAYQDLSLTSPLGEIPDFVSLMHDALDEVSCLDGSDGFFEKRNKRTEGKKYIADFKKKIYRTLLDEVDIFLLTLK